MLVPDLAVGTDQGGRYVLVVGDGNVVEAPRRRGRRARGSPAAASLAVSTASSGWS